MEGVAMNLDIILRILQNAVPIQKMILVGGLSQSEVNQQIISDVFGMPVERMEYLEEATSIGAAVIAGVGAGILPGFESVKDFNHVREVRNNDPEVTAFYQKRKQLFEDLYQSQIDFYEKLADETET